MKKLNLKKVKVEVACALSIGVFSLIYIQQEQRVVRQQEIIQIQDSQIERLEQINSEETEKVAVLTKQKEQLETNLESARQRNVDLRGRINGNREEIEQLEIELEQKKSMGRTITVKVTGYCPCSYCCGEWAYLNPGITASGTVAKYGTIAAPPSIPFGTKMKIEGYGDMIFTVEDTGSAVVYDDGIYVIDMWMPTHEQAYAVGNSIVQATILD
mgnify:FL=1